METMKTLTIGNSTYDITDDGAVRFDGAQSLTGLQQAQARENIGIVSDARYYPDLDQAIQDINEGHDEQAIAYGPGAKVKVFTAENGRLTAMLLADVSESAQITINKDIDLVLNGKTLTFTTATAGLTFGADTKCVINGEVAGSAIKTTEGLSRNGAFVLIKFGGKELIANGGSYECIVSLPGSKYHAVCIQQSIADSTLVVKGCSFRVQNTGLGGAMGLMCFPGTHITVTGCSITAISEKCKAISIQSGGSTTIKDSYAYARTNAQSQVHYDEWSNGVRIATNTAICKIYNSKIVAEATGDNSYEPWGTGITNEGTLFLNDVDCFGTHSGVSNGGVAVYVSGGTYTGYSHGGFYFHQGKDGEAFVKDSVIRCGNYPTDGFFKDLYAVDGENGHAIFAGFYVATPGNEAATNGSTVYLDGCAIGYPGKTAFVLRGTDGEQNCTVNISNSTIVDGATAIRVDNETHKLNVGVGTNITTYKISNPQWSEFTGLNYRRYNEDETVDGKDCAALSSELSRILNRLGGIINAEEVAY
jgi:hypothetical protein